MLDKLVSDINANVSGANASLKTYEAEGATSAVVIDSSSVLAVAKYLRTYAPHPFRVLQVVSGVDYPEAIEVNYMLATFDPANHYEIIVKTSVAKPADGSLPKIDSVCEVWKAANFQERETYDMVGIEFTNHPDPRRILCPDDWEGWPLRKDYVVAEKYHGMDINPEEKMNVAERTMAGMLDKLDAGQSTEAES